MTNMLFFPLSKIYFRSLLLEKDILWLIWFIFFSHNKFGSDRQQQEFLYTKMHYKNIVSDQYFALEVH